MFIQQLIKLKLNQLICFDVQVTVHGGELNGEDRLFILEQVQLGVYKIGAENYGDLAGWTKDIMDRKFGPEWHCIVGKKDSFGSCLCPISGCYLNFSVGEAGILIFKTH